MSTYGYLPQKNFYKNDPKWMYAKYKGKCHECNKIISAGEQMFYYPKTKTCYCASCGEKHYHDFQTMREYEEYA